MIFVIIGGNFCTCFDFDGLFLDATRHIRMHARQIILHDEGSVRSMCHNLRTRNLINIIFTFLILRYNALIIPWILCKA